MTNSEAIKQLKERYDIGQKEYLNFVPQYIESLKMAMESLEENDKLKAEIEQFSNELISARIENELLRKKNELTNHYFEQYAAAIDEIEKLKEDYSVLARQYNNVENSSIRYYNEVEQLKAELEQSVKFPLTNADKIRSMSDEELAEFIQDVQCDNHGYFVDKLLSKSANPICILEMLKREVKK